MDMMARIFLVIALKQDDDVIHFSVILMLAIGFISFFFSLSSFFFYEFLPYKYFSYFVFVQHSLLSHIKHQKIMDD